MKIQHNPNPPPWYTPRSVVLSAAYEDEVQRSTEKLERAYARAQKRVEQAEARLNQTKKHSGSGERKARRVAELQAVLDIRRAELEDYRRMMLSVPASATHRGTKSFRPVPDRGSGPQ
jgi:hypothetical protein